MRQFWMTLLALDSGKCDNPVCVDAQTDVDISCSHMPWVGIFSAPCISNNGAEANGYTRCLK